jgi:TamB, inner membrane protein subunit of TAM complex
MALVILVLILVGAALATLQTGWAKNQIRQLIVRQANQFLTARLEIGALGGSIFRGIQLGDIRLSKDGQPLISIDNVTLAYSLRELLQPGVVIKRVSVVRPRIAATRGADGRWDLATLVKREAREEERTGPGRPIEIVSIVVQDATVTLSEDVAFGAAHIPTRYEQLDATLSFKYVPVRWALNLERVSFRGSSPDLTMTRLSGGLENGPAGLGFNALSVVTPRSTFTLTGRIVRGDTPTTVDLQVHAPKFAFQEWGGVLHGLRNIAVDAQFDTTLRGPLTRLGTDLTFQSNAGAIRGTFALNTTVPGWLGQGTVNVNRINLARWLGKPDKPSDITGRVTFDLAFGFGEHFPRGSYIYDGPHAMFMNYAGDNIHARGTITADAVLIAQATALAYGADVRTVQGSIRLTEPFAYHFPGTVASLDLRRLPPAIPVPHVESALTFAYDADGSFTRPFITGRARFARSEFLGATIGDGMIGTIDTSVSPLTFSGDGEIDGVNLGRFGAGLDVGWMKDPHYAGTIDGRFHVDGSGTDRRSVRIAGGGRVHRADMLGGRIADADVTIDIADGTLRTSFDGTLASIDPAIAFADQRLDATLTGVARMRLSVRDLLLRSPSPADYDVEGTATLRSSRVRGIAVDTATFDGAFRDGVATIRRVEAAGPAFEASGAGSIATAACGTAGQGCPTNFLYTITRADVERLRPVIGGELTGLVATTGRLTGTLERPHLVGDATLTRFTAAEFEALSVTGTYDVTSTGGRFDATTAHANMRGSLLKAFGVSLTDATATLALTDRRVTLTAELKDSKGRSGSVDADAVVDPGRREASLQNLTVTLSRSPWRLVAAATAPVVAWSNDQISLGVMTFAGRSADERIAVSGTWRVDGHGALRVVATRVSLDTLQGALEAPARYGGVLNLDATIRGTRRDPIVTGRIDVTDGRIRRFAYQRLAGRVDYTGGDFSIDVRLDQSPGVWIAATGTVPAGVFDRELPERNVDVAITSSPIGLGLLEGLTDAVSNISGQMQIDVKAIGTSRDPHAQGSIDVSSAAFLVASTGVRYQNGRATLRLARDRIDVQSLHLEDSSRHTLDLRGSLGTHEMSVGDLEIDVTAKRFEALRNEFGKVDLDAALHLRGKLEAPQVVGELSIASGTLNVDEILDRTLLRPYAIQPIGLPNLDAVTALNPWSRSALDVSLHIPQELRLTGENLQVAQGTPIGLGDVNLRVGGDLYLFKGQNGALSITGSLDRITGTYSFQGRRFDIDESKSSINFVGDLNPEMYVTVTRQISGVEARVTIIGDLHNPELRLSSTPPLDASDILSLIVFNASANDLTAPQQQELAVRAATIAAGFLAKPILSAIEHSLGLDILEISTNDGTGRGTRVTIGQEIAPGLVARFSRQFGQDEFDEATVEYYLSRLLRIRATFSDAGSATVRSPFRRVERAGIDLLLFFSF